MGFRAQRKIITLQFADEDLDGLEIRCRSLSMGGVLSILDEVAEVRRTGSLTTSRRFVKLFIEGDPDVQIPPGLIDWNLENEDGEPTPVTKEGFTSHEVDLCVRILLAWIDAILGISVSLGKDSTSGEPSPEELTLPMEPLSASPAS